MVTEMMLPGTTMSIRWVPSEPGNWLFHCHFPFHVSPYLSLNKIPDPDDPETMGHGMDDMAGMILGIRVRPAHSRSATAQRPPAVRARLSYAGIPSRFGSSERQALGLSG